MGGDLLELAMCHKNYNDVGTIQRILEGCEWISIVAVDIWLHHADVANVLFQQFVYDQNGGGFAQIVNIRFVGQAEASNLGRLESGSPFGNSLDDF